MISYFYIYEYSRYYLKASNESDATLCEFRGSMNNLTAIIVNQILVFLIFYVTTSIINQ